MNKNDYFIFIGMKVKKKEIGKLHYCRKLDKYIKIEEGQADLLEKLEMFHVLTKDKKDAKTYKGHNERSDSDSDGEGNVE